MTYETLLYETNEGVATVTINRPEKRNALNQTVLGDLRVYFETIESDASIRAVIITGAGDRAFVAGADVKELTVLDANTGKEAARRGQRVFELIENMGKPVIAAIRGYALGGGCELAMACTLRVAAESASFGQPEVKLGLIPGYGGSQRLPRLVGKGRALEMILTGEPVSAQEAYRMGLVNRVVPDADLMATADALARKIISQAPIAVKLALEAVHHGMELTRRGGESLEAALFGLCCGTEDMKEGTQAFLEKRRPRFLGK
ncbi:MAG: enoyl-CoA hydratase/isomerase family protein [Terriglobia bacterium]